MSGDYSMCLQSDQKIFIGYSTNCCFGQTLELGKHFTVISNINMYSENKKQNFGNEKMGLIFSQ